MLREAIALFTIVNITAKLFLVSSAFCLIGQLLLWRIDRTLSVLLYMYKISGIESNIFLDAMRRELKQVLFKVRCLFGCYILIQKPNTIKLNVIVFLHITYMDTLVNVMHYF